MKRMIAILLVLLFVFLVFAGCSDNQEIKDETGEVTPKPEDTTGDQESSDEDLTPETVHASFQTTLVPITGEQLTGSGELKMFCVSGDALFFAADLPSDQEVQQDPLMDELYSEQLFNTHVFAVDSATGNASLLTGYKPFEIPEEWGGYVRLNGLVPGADRTVWVSEQVGMFRYNLPEDFVFGEDDASIYYEEGQNMNRLVQLDVSGNVLNDLILDCGNNGHFTSVLVDENGYIFAADFAEVYVFDPQGVYLGVLDKMGVTGELLYKNTGVVGIRSWETGEQMVFYPADPASLTIGNAEYFSSSQKLILGSNTYNYVYMNNGVLFGSMDETSDPERIVSLLDVDVDFNTIQDCYFMADGRLVSIEEKRGSEQKQYQLVLISGVDSASLPETKELTMACYGMSSQLRQDVVAFNRSNTNGRIRVMDYSEYNTAEQPSAGLDRLKQDLDAGQIPDIIWSNSQMPMEWFTSRELLADLWPMIDQDTVLTRDDLMVQLFEALSVDGALYQITDSFSIQTAANLTSTSGDRTSWTVDDAAAVLASMAEGGTILDNTQTSASVLSSGLSRVLAACTNWNDPQNLYNFDNDAFRALLMFANMFPDSTEFQLSRFASENVRMKSGQQMMVPITVSDFLQLRYTELETGEPVSLLGYPTAGNTGSCFLISSSYAITSACADQDLAWSFIRNCLTEDYQKTVVRSGLPTNRLVFDAMAEEAMTPVLETDPETGEEVRKDVICWIHDEPYLLLPLTQSQYDAIWNAYASCQTVGKQNAALAAMISEEAAAYFADEATLDEVIGNIQSRAALLQ